MESILYEIFTGCYEAEPPRSEAQRDVGRRLASYENQVKEAFGLKFLDQLNTLHTEKEGQYHYSCFRSGFLLGIRLMLEVLEA